MSFVSCNGRAAFRTSEAKQGNTSLNGDLDAADSVLHFLDHSLALPAVNLAIDASGPLDCAGDWFAFGVNEVNQGAADLNSDGDATDTVIHVYNGATGFLRNLNRAVSNLHVTSSLVAFTVSEASQGGTMLNGDGDTSDIVIHVFRPLCDGGANLNLACDDAGDCPAAACGQIVNVGEAADSDFVAMGNTVAFRTKEASEGNVDLNGDSDTSDSVVQVYEAATATLTNTSRESKEGLQFVDLDNDTHGDVVAFRTHEKSQGNVSFNGDLDTNDSIMTLFCLPAAGCSGGPGIISLNVDVRGFDAVGDWVAFSSSERHQFTVTNMDPDRSDRVVQIYQISTGTLTSTQLATRSQLVINGDKIIFAVSERFQGKLDRNADGDVADSIVTIWDGPSGTAVNTQRAVRRCPNLPFEPLGTKPHTPHCFASSGDAVMMQTSERHQAKTDLNADVDLRDTVIESWTISSSSLNTLGVAAAPNATGFAVGANTFAFRISEKYHLTMDVNGDGDARDHVMYIYNPSTATLSSVGASGDDLFLLDGDTLVFRTREQGPATEGENLDMNADLDKDDYIMQYEAF